MEVGGELAVIADAAEAGSASPQAPESEPASEPAPVAEPAPAPDPAPTTVTLPTSSHAAAGSVSVELPALGESVTEEPSPDGSSRSATRYRSTNRCWRSAPTRLTPRSRPRSPGALGDPGQRGRDRRGGVGARCDRLARVAAGHRTRARSGTRAIGSSTGARKLPPPAPAPRRCICACRACRGRFGILQMAPTSPTDRAQANERESRSVNRQGHRRRRRIRKRDVLAAASAKATRLLPGGSQCTSRESARRPATQLASEGPDRADEPAAKVIATRMVESLAVSAQLTTVIEVDVTRIALLRNRVKDDFLTREGVKLSYMPFFAKATCGRSNSSRT